MAAHLMHDGVSVFPGRGPPLGVVLHARGSLYELSQCCVGVSLLIHAGNGNSRLAEGLHKCSQSIWLRWLVGCPLLRLLLGQGQSKLRLELLHGCRLLGVVALLQQTSDHVLEELGFCKDSACLREEIHAIHNNVRPCTSCPPQACSSCSHNGASGTGAGAACGAARRRYAASASAEAWGDAADGASGFML